MAAAWALLASGLIVVPARARGPQSTSDEWPPVPPEELALKDDPANPGASAILLYREISTDDVKAVGTNYYRVKILTESGKKYADIEIPYLNKAIEIRNIRARTVQPDGRAADFNGEVFDKLVVKTRRLKFQAKTFTLPDVRAGSIIEYSYTVHWREKMPDVLEHPEQYLITFSTTIPTVQWVIPHELFTRRARFSLRPLPKAHLTFDWRGLPQGTEPRWQPDGTVRLEIANVPAFEEEDLMPPEQTLKSRVDFYYTIGYPGNPSSFWRERATRGAEGLKKFLGESKTIDREAAQRVSDNDAPETKLRKLYDRAQQIRYLSYEPAKTQQEEKRQNLRDNKSVADILKHGYASANEINLLFVALARAAGFEAAPVMVADRHRNFFTSNLLDERQLDAMVVWVRVGTKDYYFDPASRYCPFNLLPWFETATTGIRVDKNSPGLVEIPAPQSDQAMIERKGSFELDNDGNLQGNVHVRFTGQEALDRRLENSESDEAGRRKEMEDEVKGWLPTGSTVELKGVSNWKESGESLDADLTLKIPRFATSTGRRLLLSSGAFQVNERHAFQSAKRVHPVYFRYPYQEVDEISLRLPPGRKVASLPNPRVQNSSFASYEATSRTQGETVELKRKLVINGILFPVAYYPALRLFFNTVRAGDEQQIVLENATTAQVPQHN